jgi:hypothetical protein
MLKQPDTPNNLDADSWCNQAILQGDYNHNLPVTLWDPADHGIRSATTSEIPSEPR